MLMDEQGGQQEVVYQEQAQEQSEQAPCKEHLVPAEVDIGVVDGTQIST